MNLLNLFKNSDQIRECGVDTFVFQEGDPSDVMYVVLDGEIDIKVGDETLETLGAGEILGEMALIDAKPRSATAVARTGSRLAIVDAVHFQFMVQQTPYFAIHVMRVLADRLRKTNAKIES